ncbi:MAG: hypothetical protein A3F90_02515 [Deltaproteobacteria bacterium RIFCSPLOWO2_12_FULL_60_19]|nr:MAG: hypothetical protein A3F90_02515 [Deltaproteobacteria bacterium RIFCSPLOWO2_12_FULL_60_19]
MKDCANYSVIGKRLPLIDAVTKVTGEAKFTGDLFVPGMLIGAILRSPYPHARILNIDASRALKHAGVRAVVTGKDTAGVKYGALEHLRDEAALATDKVRYIGDEVAAVAAVDEETAREALDLIDVEYEPLPAVFTTEEAMRPGAPRIHDHVENNVSLSLHIPLGDVEAGFARSDFIFEDSFETQCVAHCPLEPHISLAACDGGQIVLWSSTQGPFYLRRDLSLTLKLPSSKIRVIKPFVGGGFGGKREMTAGDFCAALLAVKTSRPVKIAYDREEEFSATRRRVPMKIYLKAGVMKDGTLVAKRCRVIADGGAYNGRGPMIVASGASQMTLVYRFPHFLFEGHHVYTNNPVTSSMRGFGNNQIRFADDSMMERMAKELGIDPVELRLKNVRRPGETSLMGAKVTTCGLPECIEKVAERGGLHKKRAQNGSGGNGRQALLRGFGVASAAYISGCKLFFEHDSSAAIVKLEEDGSVCLLTGASDIGQGSNTVLAQLVAEELGIAFEDMRVVSADTDTTPMDLGAYGSRTTFVAGNAVLAAARDAKKQVLEVAAERLEADSADLEIRERWICVKGSPQRGMTFQAAVSAALNSPDGKSIMGRGYYNPPTDYDPRTRRGNVSAAYSFAAQSAEVEVNPETGEVRVINLVAAQDCGFAINPMATEGQIEGSVSMGLGQALYEDLVMEEGQTVNASFSAYKIPSVRDMPPVESHLIQTIDPEGPHGAKGIGEMTLVPTSPAIANAIYDAIGVQIKSLPITPEKILAALKEKRACS